MRLKIYGLLIFIFWVMPYLSIAYITTTLYDKWEKPFWVVVIMLMVGVICMFVAGLITSKKGDE